MLRNAAASRRVVVTGAASGVGAALASQLGRAGHHVHLVDIDGAAVRDVASELLATGCHASWARLDVRDPADIGPALADVGAVDVLVNNAGLQFVSPLAEFPPERWQQLVDVMLVGPALLMRSVLPGMRERGFGRIVNIGSMHSLVASPFKSAYVAAKHGLLGLAKTLALETGDVEITVNTICPAYVRTPLVEMQIADQARTHGLSEQQVIDEIMLKPMPKRTFVTVDEIAATVEFLISDSARNITGQAIAIDGGWTAR